MTDRLDRLESEVAKLVTRLDRLESRLSPAEPGELEAPSQPAVAPDGLAPADTFSAIEPAAAPSSVARGLGLLGRGFLVLGGAFLLRSLTDAGVLPQATGIALGMLYAVVWLGAADRAAGKGSRLTAVLYGLASSVIAYPLLWEATTRFGLLSARSAAVGIVLVTAVALVVAWRRELQLLAWFFFAGALVTNLVIMVTHRSWILGAVVSLLAAAASNWLARSRRWVELRWPVAIATDLVVLMVISAAVRSGTPGVPPGPSATAVAAVIAGLVIVYFASFASLTLKAGSSVGVFEVAQGLAVLIIGFGGELLVAGETGSATLLFGSAALLGSVACYGVAFAIVARRDGRGANFLFYTSLALTLAIWGLSAVTDGAAVVAALCAFALMTAVLGGRFDRVTLRAHAALYLAAAVIASGLAARVAEALVLPVAAGGIDLDRIDLLVVATTVACFTVVVVTSSRPEIGWQSRIPSLVMASVAVLGTLALILELVVTDLDRAGPIDPAAVAAARTAVLAAAAVCLALAGSRRRLVELGMLVYPVLVIGGLKLVVEDLRVGRPVTLFLAFACYGAALIVAPRLLRSHALRRPAETGD